MERKFHRLSSEGEVIIWNGENPNETYPVIEEDVTVPNELLSIAEQWKARSDAHGDVGCCVLGAKMNFEYQGKKYKMYSQSQWQGEGSWVPYKEFVVEELKKIGATNIYYEWGFMD